MAPRKQTDGDSQSTTGGSGTAASAVLDSPEAMNAADQPAGPAIFRTPEGFIHLAEQSVHYWFDDTQKTVAGADVVMWCHNLDDTSTSWTAHIKRDLDGNFKMTYPNPGGGADYVVQGRHQLSPLVDQAIRLGTQMVLADHIP